MWKTVERNNDKLLVFNLIIGAYIKGYDLLVNKLLFESDKKVGTFFALTAFSFSVVSRKARSRDSFF